MRGRHEILLIIIWLGLSLAVYGWSRLFWGVAEPWARRHLGSFEALLIGIRVFGVSAPTLIVAASVVTRAVEPPMAMALLVGTAVLSGLSARRAAAP